ncbi:HD domain-containing protein [Paracoccus methylarcula]|nr:HD domain-containing protein [Paracoccus methylarcula]
MEKLIQKALAFAVAQHEGQIRKGPSPIAYTHHLAEVSALVAAFGGETEVIAAAWLHDVVEDTDASINQIAEKFGPVIAELVDEVTDDPQLSKAEQRAAQIAHAPNLSLGAALIKTADQTSNMGGLVASPPNWDAEKREKYIRKAEAVVAGLKIPNEMRRAFENAASRARRLTPQKE